MSSWYSPASWFSSGKPSAPAPVQACYYIEGFVGCPFVDAAIDAAEHVRKTKGGPNGPPLDCQVRVHLYERPGWARRLLRLQEEFPQGKAHRTSPLTYQGCTPETREWIGGCGAFHRHLRDKNYLP